jgi:uncharacterized protein YodC (DUF2158 family)
VSNNAIQVGDTVELKSGGPLMTVSQIFRSTVLGQEYKGSQDMATCTWFDGKDLKNGDFPLETLKHSQGGGSGFVSA